MQSTFLRHAPTRSSGPAIATTIIAAATIFAPDTPSFAQRYEMTVYPIPQTTTEETGRWSALIEGMNNRGEIVGWIWRSRPSTDRAVLWRPTGQMVVLPSLLAERDDQDDIAYGINDDGVIVGNSEPLRQEFGQQAVVWPNTLTVKPVIDRDSTADDINNSGVIIGDFAVGFLNFEPFLWENGEWFSLYPPMKVAWDINNNRQVVGRSPGRTPYLWENGKFTALPVLVPGAEAVPFSINDHGVASGWSERDDQVRYPVIWENGQVREMPTLVPGREGTINRINNQGLGTGSCEVGYYEYRSTLWRNNLVTVLDDLVLPLDPNGPDWVILGGEEPNDRGQIGLVVQEGGRGANIARLDPIDTGLTLWGIEPSQPGQRNTIEIHHVTPGGRVTLLWGHTRSDPTPLEQCHDAMIDVEDPRIAGTATADENGIALINVHVPPQTDGLFILQAIDHATCEVSPPSMCLFRVAQ